mgnify:CR=1 FL=1
MKNIYHIHKSSNSYWNNEWYDTDYFLCDTEEEYQQLKAKHKAKRAEIEKEYNESKGNPSFNVNWRYHNFRFTDEHNVHASEYYYAHEWQGKTFDAVGFCWFERLERSTHTTYYLRPGSVGKVTPCTDRGIGWMYGS